MIEPTVYVDMDGVLVNFHKHACSIFNVTYPEKSVLGWDWLFNHTQLSIEEFIGRIDNKEGFWRDLEPFPWIHDLIQFLDVTVPHWNILTMATQDPRSWQGKCEWVQRYFRTPGIYKLVMLHGDKGRIARPGDILIDDSHKQCESWRKAGGFAYQWIEYTHDHDELARNQLERVKAFIEENLQNKRKDHRHMKIHQ